ncbi:MAG: helix-turn-helix domain-containing protein [Methanothrix sp.]|nr:MarR family transcriptional regulator [Methanothrix sp.]MCX8206540.1 helix-turn-helix domain-containing protein [Methanothrix sp.]
MNLTSRLLIRAAKALWLCILFLLVMSTAALSAYENRSLVLNVYLDWTGKALITGYTDSIEGLPFLNSSQYSYENSTSQIYALTNTLTSKAGDAWTLQIQTYGSYERYSMMLYLPGDAMLSSISPSDGLSYLVSSTNQSLAVDLQGYDLVNPSVVVEYRQPLLTATNTSSINASLPPAKKSQAYFAVAAASLILIASGSAFLILRRRMGSHVITPQPELQARSLQDAPRKESDESLRSEIDSDTASYDGEMHDDTQDVDQPAEIPRAPFIPGSEPIEITREMAAVIETLTAREKAVMEALLKRSGRMTQADLRYETGIPKSSLSGILNSLERRKLIKKREWGRTNVIEITDWFVSRKEHS